MVIPKNLSKAALFRQFPFLRWPLLRHDELARTHTVADPSLKEHLSVSTFSVRMLRYWWAGQAIAEESRRQGRALWVLDVGCERGWLKFFTPPEAVARWVGLDWDVRQECINNARYDEVIRANFDEPLPLPNNSMDVVVNNHVMEHLPRPGSTMAEMSRVLREGGIFLGGSPTMPHPFARMRERWLRRKLRLGRVAPGGHINCLSPARWKSLMEDTGLKPEFATGSHAVRFTGSWLESQSWWIRLNQIWGGLFPSLGSECYVLGRKTSAWASQTELHRSANAHWRPIWAGLAAAAVLIIAWGSWSTWQTWRHQDAQKLVSWIEKHQEGRDHFIVSHDDSQRVLGHRPDVRVAEGLSGALHLLKQIPHAHMLVTEADLAALCHWDAARDLVIHSRLPRNFEDDLILVRSGIAGTSLRDYWFSEANSKVAATAEHGS